jgi:fucose 4-O-acetylase-like acetyltransferase
MTATGRNQTIDLLRGMAMLLVIYGHALEMFFVPNMRADHGFDRVAFQAWSLIYSFHMPAFYFVSGMTAIYFATRPFRKILLTALTFILLADFAHLLGAVPFVGVAIYHHVPTIHIVKNVIRPFVAGWGYCLVLPWFLVSLALVQVLAWLHIHARLMGKALIWFGVVAIYLLVHHYGKLYFQAQSWAVGLAFFLAGREAMWHEHFIPEKPRSVFLLLACLAAALLFFSYPLNRGCMLDPSQTCSAAAGTQVFAVSLLYGLIGFPPLFFFTAFAGIAALGFLALAMQGTRFMPALSWVGRNTLPLLILNGFVLVFAEKILSKVLSIGLLGVPSLIWAALLTAIQIALLPVVIPALTKLYDFSRSLADLSLIRLNRLIPLDE